MSLHSTPSAEKPLANTVSESEANDQSDCSFQHIIKWHQRLVLQAGDFVLYQQLATLQLHDLEMVDRRMRASFDYFRFQGPMPSFQFRKMRCCGHIRGLLSQIVGGTGRLWHVRARPLTRNLSHQPVAMGVLGYRVSSKPRIYMKCCVFNTVQLASPL
jgi:hypothetical protein